MLNNWGGNMSVKIMCWNVNGIRAASRKGFLEWLHRESPDILCAQEIKARPDQLTKELREPEHYHSYWNWPEKKGYGGVATFSKVKPSQVQYGFGINGFDEEGRVIIAEYLHRNTRVQSGAENVGNKVGLRRMVFAQPLAGPGSIKVAQGEVFQAIGLAVPFQDGLKHEF